MFYLCKRLLLRKRQDAVSHFLDVEYVFFDGAAI